MGFPLWDNWLFGAETFLALLPSVRMLWLGGFYGSGKTVFATFLAAYLMDRGLVARAVSNIKIAGACAALERLPVGTRYYSEYLDREFLEGDLLPLEDTAIILDEAGLFMSDWSSASDYVAALRKTNLYLLMPSINSPNPRVRMFEVRRTLNWYSFGLPAWGFTWFLTNGKSVSERGQFVLWRPHRMFGISDTRAFPIDDGGIVEAMTATFKLDTLRENRAAAMIKKKISVYDFNNGATDAVIDMMAASDENTARVSANKKRGK